MDQDETKSVRERRSEAEFIGPTDVWAHMARLLIETHGPRIRRPEMRAEIEEGLALVTWTEAHYISEAEYADLVERARALASNDEG